MKQRIFGYVGAHHGRMGKLGIGRKGKVSHECGWLWSNGRRGMDLDFGGRKSYYRKQHKAENSDKRPSGEHKEVANGQCIIYGTGCQRFSRPGEGEDADAVFYFSPKNSMAVVSPCRKQRNCLCEYPARTSEEGRLGLEERVEERRVAVGLDLAAAVAAREALVERAAALPVRGEAARRRVDAGPRDGALARERDALAVGPDLDRRRLDEE